MDNKDLIKMCVKFFSPDTIWDNLFMDTHYFSVPVRLVWDNWKKFNGGRYGRNK